MLLGACKCSPKERRNRGSDCHKLLTKISRSVVDVPVCQDFKDRFAVGHARTSSLSLLRVPNKVVSERKPHFGSVGGFSFLLDVSKSRNYKNTQKSHIQDVLSFVEFTPTFQKAEREVFLCLQVPPILDGQLSWCFLLTPEADHVQKRNRLHIYLLRYQ
jgi:hypothetical protein